MEPWTTDEAVLEQLGERLQRHRLERNLTQERLAHEAGVSVPTVQRLEAGHSVQLTSLLRVLRALGLLGGLDALVPLPRPSPMALLEREGRRRQRASADPVDDAPTGWTWGDE